MTQNFSSVNDLPTPASGLSAHERRIAASVAGTFFLRLLGLFMITPVLTLYAEDYAGATLTLMGAALGIHGLTQGALQIPFGAASDRYGRKPVIIFGLLITVAGGLLCALTHNIYLLILGRALMGAGAIAGALLALTADQIRESQRPKAMAIIGISIGTAFSLAFVLGPLLDAIVGLRGLFWLSVLLSALALLCIFTGAPSHPSQTHLRPASGSQALSHWALFRQPHLLPLNLGILILHSVQMALFVILPLVLRDELALASKEHWLVYCPALVIGSLLAVPLLKRAHTHQHIPLLTALAIGSLTLTFIGLAELRMSVAAVIIILSLFFFAFTFLEGHLPSYTAKVAPLAQRGAALGIFSTCQYLGIFIGGALGGLISQHQGNTAVLLTCALLCAVWWGLHSGAARAAK